ncbi:M43 family zinc metalloprotease [Fulvivirgaceae bacterium BMA10]|uniref:M43 family zinc metalloprotease n=1 Tax=Splendidivirga corallicola TaxID=3051826 RepID=A0ABT8KV16_9BACT|nr:M43 family zinc metalloprotease [Fulvivirgaceae bacterium BMA10]
MNKKFVLKIMVLFFLMSCKDDDCPVPPDDGIKTLPVVVHIIHKDGEAVGEGSNLSTPRINEQIAILNSDFRRSKWSRGWNIHPDGADAQIEFRLAAFDPNGNKSTGIRRVNGDKIEPGPGEGGDLFDWIVDYGFWPPNDYINIWVMPQEKVFFGTARMPLGSLPGLDDVAIDKVAGDGILINTLYFGKPEDNNKVLGRTLTREMGRFLGLFNLWGKGPVDIWKCEDTDKITDYCDDTPPVTQRTGNCTVDEVIYACDGTPALRNNYMDYTDETCMNMFTNDQVSRMQWVLENSPRRKSLTSSKAIKR